MGEAGTAQWLPAFKEGGVLQEEDGLEAAMGSKGPNLFFVGIKTAPLCGEGEGSMVHMTARLGEPKEGRGEGWSVTEDGDLLCVCCRRQRGAGLWHCLANQE